MSVLFAACGSGTDATATNRPDEPTIDPTVVDGALLAEYQCERKENDIEASIPLAWSETPSDLPVANSLAIDRNALVASLETVTVLETTTLTFTTQR